MAEPSKSSVIDLLKQRFGERLQRSQAVREQHGHTLSHLPNQPPDAVVFVDNRAEVEEIVGLCREWSFPLVPYGVGTSLEGQVNAPLGGISIDFSTMNQVIEVLPEDMLVRVQPGVTREQLNEALKGTGLFFPIDPGANASLGGMAATRASGTNAVRYGTMKDAVISLEAVMADGRTINTASRARKSSAGYDLTRLLVGSEGTLGVITELTIKLFPQPEAILAGRLNFPSVDAACNAVIQGIQCAIPFARIELADEVQVMAFNRYSQLDLPETPSLFLEFHGSETELSAQSALFAEIARDLGGSEMEVALRAEDRSKLWKARHNAYFANLALRPGCRPLTTDVCVPISRLATCVRETQEDIQSENFLAPIVGHVGDGNFHVLVLTEGDDDDELERAKAFASRLSERAIRLGGTCSGEHGIGQGKQDYLIKELGGAVDVMRLIKKALDPDNILNPGKIFV